MTAGKATHSTRQTHFPIRTLVLSALVLLLHFVLVYVLDAAGLVESLLSPNGDRLLWALPLAVLLYALRFGTYFVIPGLIVGALVTWRLDASRRLTAHGEQVAPLSRS